MTVPRKQMPGIPREQAVALYRSGRPMAALAHRYDVSAEWLAARFREWGEPVRETGGAGGAACPDGQDTGGLPP